MSAAWGDIEAYLFEIKDAVRMGRYRIDRNKKRQDNLDLFLEFVLTENMARDILLSLTPSDFSQILQNEHIGYEQERLYVFGKDVTLLKRAGSGERKVSLYIKMNKLPQDFVIIISFHEQKHPLHYYFKERRERHAGQREC